MDAPLGASLCLIARGPAPVQTAGHHLLNTGGLPQILLPTPAASVSHRPFDHPPTPLPCERHGAGPVQEGGKKAKYVGYPRAPARGGFAPLHSHPVDEKRVLRKGW